MCFRPLTGTLLSNRGIKNVRNFKKSFRPLTGTLLSKHSMMNDLRKLKVKDVSVPSRGLSYLNDNEETLKIKEALCFRPLTGTLLSKHHPPILPPQAAFFAGLRGK